MIKECKVHGNTEFSMRVRGKYITYTCKKCIVESIKRNHLKRKLEMIEYMGGKCSNCGYNKNLAALEFHHVNPLNKSFEISYHSAKNWLKIKDELDKCILLCSNCYKEIHNPSMDFDLLVYHTKDK